MVGVLILLSSPGWFSSFSEYNIKMKIFQMVGKVELEKIFIHLLNNISNDLVLDKRISPKPQKILKIGFKIFFWNPTSVQYAPH